MVDLVRDRERAPQVLERTLDLPESEKRQADVVIAHRDAAGVVGSSARGQRTAVVVESRPVVPLSLRGLGMTFILTGLMAIGFMAFGGIQL